MITQNFAPAAYVAKLVTRLPVLELSVLIFLPVVSLVVAIPYPEQTAWVALAL
ncbi:MAG: hypothetical protein ACHQRJ_11330 [Alphaproteobacteria bacterium]